jgi:2-polyprenyl-3-methyl-5-hydroxy-6-metoxy-1,4-benzoquinol methylase
MGRRLGLYDALAASTPMTPDDLAGAAGITRRYAREWLEQQAAAGLLDVVEPAVAEDERRFLLPLPLAPLFVDPANPSYLLGIPPIVQSLAVTLPSVAHAYSTGDGVGFDRFGAELREGIAALNRPGFANELARWLSTMPDIARRLDDGGTVLDAGCGLGWSTIALANAFPRARIVGIDLDEESIRTAEANARASATTGSVTFRLADAGGSADESELFDLVTVFEALHDMGDPVGALASFRARLAPGGAVLVADEKVADEFTAPASEIERMQYAFSVLHCLPATIAESALVAHGTVLRAPTVRRWSAEAGFARCVDLPVDHEFWRFYRLD